MKPPAQVVLFEETMIPHLNAAYNLARWLARNEQDAQDIVQEAYLRAFRYFDGFRGGDGKAWLLAVVRNTCITWRARGKRATAVPFDEELHGAGESSATAESRLVEQARFAGVRDCLDALPAEFREVMVMRELEEMAYRDIAEATNLPIGTVMSRLSRARQRLYDCVISKMKGARK